MASPDPDQRLIHALRTRGQRVTSQRVVIYRELDRRQRHLTAEQVLDAVARDLPGTSLPTVYATLDLLVELELARRFDAGTGATLYDARTEPHHHTVCQACGRVEDLEAGIDTDGLLRAARRAGFQPDATDVLVTGRCAACAGALTRG